VAICLHLGSVTAADALDLASASEDKLLGVVRTLEVQADSAYTAIRSAVSALDPSASNSEEAAAGRAEAEYLINEVYDVVEKNFDDARGTGFNAARWRSVRDAALSRPLKDAAASHSAVREMLATLKDPYSRFLTPEEFGAMAKYDVSGVGLNLGTWEDLKSKTDLLSQRSDSTENNFGTGKSDTGGVWVVGIIRNSSAATAGMCQGDEILELDGAPLDHKSPFQIASMLQGKQEEEEDIFTRSSRSVAHEAEQQSRTSDTVRLTVRHLDGQVQDVTLHRPSVHSIQSPVTSKLEGQVGYVRLTSFTARAQRDVASAVQKLEADGARRLVLDLRGNRGGLVSEGIEVARLFLDGDAVIVRTQGKSRSSSDVPATAPGPALTAAPLAVLVDGHTASASEILAGALQDNCRGVLVGRQRTYGKGLIQSVYELGDGSGLVLTVGKYLTPGGTDIDWEGLGPDFGRMPTPQQAHDVVEACTLRRQ